MIRRAACLRSNHYPRHIYVVLNDPGPNGAILFVNFTTRLLSRDAKEEVFTAADYGRLTHESVVAFWGAYPNATAQALEPFIQSGDFAILPDLPEATLQRIIPKPPGIFSSSGNAAESRNRCAPCSMHSQSALSLLNRAYIFVARVLCDGCGDRDVVRPPFHEQ